MKRNKILLGIILLLGIEILRNECYAIELGKALKGGEFKPYIGLDFEISNQFDIGISGLKSEWSDGEEVAAETPIDVLVNNVFIGNILFIGYIQPEVELSFDIDFELLYRHDPEKVSDKKELFQKGTNIFLIHLGDVEEALEVGNIDKNKAQVKMALQGIHLKILLEKPIEDELLMWQGAFKFGYMDFEVGTKFHDIKRSGLGISFMSENNFEGDVFFGLDFELYLAQHELFFDEFNPIIGTKLIFLIAPGYDSAKGGKLRFDCCYLRNKEMYEIGLSAIYYSSQRRHVRNVEDYFLAETRKNNRLSIEQMKSEGKSKIEIEKQEKINELSLSYTKKIYQEVDIKNYIETLFYFRYTSNSHILDLTGEVQIAPVSNMSVGYKVTLVYGNVFVNNTLSVFLLANFGSPVSANEEIFPQKEVEKNLLENILESAKLFGDFHIFHELAVKLYIYPLATKEMEILFYLAYRLEFYGSQSVFENGGIDFKPILGLDLSLQI